jgi:hypothetical protein
MSLVVKNRRKAKQVERAIAKRLDGLRIGILGGEDVSTSQFSIEVKTRKKFVALSWYQQAVKNAKKNKIPLLIVHITNKHHDNDLVILSLKDFEKLINLNKNTNT